MQLLEYKERQSRVHMSEQETREEESTMALTTPTRTADELLQIDSSALLSFTAEAAEA